MNPYDPTEIEARDRTLIGMHVFGIVVALAIASFIVYGVAWSMNVFYRWYWELPFQWWLQ
jgi:hypothetical protein